MEPVIVPMKQRRTVRRAVRIPCQVVRMRDFTLVARSALDVSTEGMHVLADGDVLTGERVFVSFRAPRSSRWIDVEATIARVSHGRRRDDRPFRTLGVQFRPLAWNTRSDLGRALSTMPAVKARREARIDWAATVARIAIG